MRPQWTARPLTTFAACTNPPHFSSILSWRSRATRLGGAQLMMTAIMGIDCDHSERNGRTSAAHSSPYDSARRFAKMSGRTSYSCVPTVSSTRVASRDPT